MKKTIEQIIEENGIEISTLDEWNAMDGEVVEYNEEKDNGTDNK